MDNHKIDSLEHYLTQHHHLDLNQQLNLLIELVVQPHIQVEAKGLSFFRKWSEQFQSILTIAHIDQLGKIYSSLPLNLQEDMFTDFIWPLVQLEFPDKEVLLEYFKFIKVCYNRNIIDTLRQYNMIDIAKQLMKVSEQDDHVCCQLHNLNNKQTISQQLHNKIMGFSELLSGILQLITLELKHKRTPDMENILAMSIHQLLSFCTKDHMPCQVSILLQCILKAIICVDQQIVMTMFQNFESVSYLVILFNSGEYPTLRVWCIKLFHRITYSNRIFLQKLILAIVPPSRMKKQPPYLSYLPMYYSMLEWLLNIPISMKITDNLMLDEAHSYDIPEVLELILSYLYIAPEMVKQMIVTTLLTLTRSSQLNQGFLGQHKHFLITFPKFLLSYQEPLLVSELNATQQLVIDGDDIIFKIFDSGFKLITHVIVLQMSCGKVDLLFQWQKLVQLELFKIETGDNDSVCKDPRTPRLLLRTLYTYIFNHILRNKFINEAMGLNWWKGIGLFISSFIHMMLGDLFVTRGEQSLTQMNVFQCVKFTSKIFIYKNFANLNDPWVDYQFLPKIVQFMNILVTLAKSTNLDLSKCSNLFKPQQFAHLYNHLLRRQLGSDKDNIYILRILQTIVSFYAHYILVSNFTQERYEELHVLLKSYRLLVLNVLIGGQQLKQFRMLTNDQEQLMLYTHFLYVELHMQMVTLVSDRCTVAYSSNNDYFNQLEEKQQLQEFSKSIQQILCEYYGQLSKLHFYYGQQAINFIWNYLYDILRMRKSEGNVNDADLQILINKPDTFADTMTSAEMITYHLDSPVNVDIKQNSQLKVIEIMNWADTLILQQQQEIIQQYQENYHRQSIVMMKDVNSTLNKYQKIQQVNQELFQQEKSIYDQSRTISFSS